MSYEDHARREFAAIGYRAAPGRPVFEKMVMEDVLELLEVFSKQGHSGSSAPFIAGMFQKLATFQPLAPLSGKDDEWCEVSEGVWQNIRCSHVFKGADGRAYDIDGIIWKDSDGSTYTNGNSRVYISFPYTPTRQYLLRSRDAASP